MEDSTLNAMPFQEEGLAETTGFITGEHFDASENVSDQEQNVTQSKRKMYPHHGIGKYRLYKNHSSAHDQPFTSTSW